MIEIAAYLFVSALLLFMGYLVSVFFNAIYIDPEEIRTFFPEISEHRRQQLEKFISNPRAFFQVAFLVRISSAIALGIVALRLATRLEAFHLLPIPALFLLIFAAYWILTLVLFIYLPRRISRQNAKARLIRFLPPINFIYLISSPLNKLFERISTQGTP
jgi:CBS domain containing-hemolysin-like protein